MSFINVSVESMADLTIDEVWPDGDAPEVITVDDVRAVIEESTDMHRISVDWALPTELRVFLSRDCGCDAAPQRHLHRVDSTSEEE